MKVLLDTHALLWILAGDERLSVSAVETYEDSQSLYFSIASLWEIGIKLGLRRPDFVLAENWARDIPRALTRDGVSRLDVSPDHCREVSQLPLHHRDPFDRMLIAQAQTESCAVLSIDPQLDAYGIERIW